MAIPVFDIDGACIELAKLTGKSEKYSKQRLNVLVKQKIQAPIKVGKQYLLTETQLNLLADEIKSPGRPKLEI
ncbi:MAG: hypothetical protein KAW90_04955 [Dehalococcoidales bacterium]|nr:hypothetical protein [Dehalococcoidales bacterium]